MAIWGKRDNESAAEEASAEAAPAAAIPENDPPAGAMPENDPPADAAPGNDPSAGAAHDGEPEPAYGRALAEPTAQAGEPEPGSGRAPAQASAPPVSEARAGTDAPAPVLAEDVVVIDAEAAAKGPALTDPAPDPAEIAGGPAGAQEPSATAVPALASAPGTAASPGSPDSPGSISPQRWSEILVSFVDNPRSSVTMAADAVDSAIEEVVASVRARQQALASSWQSSGTDTEQLRIALREYRRFGAQVQQMSPEEPARPSGAAAG